MIAPFVFDLDSTVLQGELLPAIGELALGDRELRGRTMESVMGAAPFAQSFPARVARLRPDPVAQAAEIARCLPRYESLCACLWRNRERCYLATGNLDVWIAPLVRELGLEGHCFSSVARVERGYVTGIDSLLDKAAVLNTLPRPIAAVGDGINDLPMLLGADVGIAFAGSHPVPSELAQAAGYVAWDEKALVTLLESLMMNGRR